MQLNLWTTDISTVYCSLGSTGRQRRCPVTGPGVALFISVERLSAVFFVTIDTENRNETGERPDGYGSELTLDAPFDRLSEDAATDSKDKSEDAATEFCKGNR